MTSFFYGVWSIYFVFFFNDTATTEIYTRPYTLSLHDALPIFSKPSTSILTRHRPRAAADSLMTREVDALFPGTTFLRDTPRRRAALFESRVPVRLARNG